MSEQDKYINRLNELTKNVDTILENLEIVLENQTEILEKLDNLSRPGSDFSIEGD